MKKRILVFASFLFVSVFASAQETLEQRIEKIPAKEKTPENIIRYGIYLNDMEMFNHGVEKAGSDIKKFQYSFNHMDLNGGSMFLGMTPLMQAAAFGRTEMVKVLLEKKVDVDETCKAPVYKTAPNFTGACKGGNMKGMTALMFAAQNGHLEVIKLLLDTKSKFTMLNVEIKEMGGAGYSGTARQWAKMHGQTEAEELIKKARKGAMGL